MDERVHALFNYRKLIGRLAECYCSGYMDVMEMTLRINKLAYRYQRESRRI